jgi:tRNA-uridine 2-sulfurtransferase
MKKRQKVLLGMSGGIDSSVAAILLQKKGFEVVGITFIFSGNIESDLHQNVRSAKLLAEKLGIEHYTVDLREDFKVYVINYFISEYRLGNTPFPCAVCNPEVKFFNLEKYANKFLCDFVATGHYALIAENHGVNYICSGVDKEKDQSFFLWGLDRDLLRRLIFPLGRLYKSEVREIALKEGFEDFNRKRESLGICFIKGKDYRNFLKDNGLKSLPGNFVDSKGNIIGKHKGIFNYTVGQRKGLGIHLNKPVFVSEIRFETNEVVLADFKEMYKTRIFLKNTRFVAKQEIKNGKIYTVKIRYRLQENSCKIIQFKENRAIVELLEPVAMVAEGQTAVFYDENRVVGGGFIESSE